MLMAELVCSPEGSAQTLHLQARIATLMALSGVFSAGGENFQRTLTKLSEAYAQWLEEKEGVLAEEEEILSQLLQAQKVKEKKSLGYEFNRLFVGPQSPTVPPYESVHRHGERLVMQKSTLDVRRWYRSEGLALAGASKEPDDYIATELEFAAYLLAKAWEGFQKNQPGEAEIYLKNYNAFYQEHLTIWLPRFVTGLFTHAREPLFLALGEMILKTVKPVPS
ncbi:molecular chaperone TorD family protein [Desulfitobacterium chlororespirans]